MAKVLQADPGIIFASCVYNADELAYSDLQKVWRGRYALDGEAFPDFNPSLEYYSNEMGKNLRRAIVWSAKLYPRQELVLGKLWAKEVEEEFSRGGKRRLNIDVGLTLKEQLLLSTNKPYSHRIYLSDGVWAELVYVYENKSYHFLPWTYPDYRHEEKIKLFNSLRPLLF